MREVPLYSYQHGRHVCTPPTSLTWGFSIRPTTPYMEYMGTSLIRTPPPVGPYSSAGPRPHGLCMCSSHDFFPLIFTEILQESNDPSGVTPFTVE